MVGEQEVHPSLLTSRRCCHLTLDLKHCSREVHLSQLLSIEQAHAEPAVGMASLAPPLARMRQTVGWASEVP